MSKYLKNLAGILRLLKYKLIYRSRLKLDFSNSKKLIYIGKHTKIDIGKKSKLILSGGDYFSDFCYISVQDGGICKVGSNIYFNTFSKIYCIHNVIIRDDSIFGSNVSIYDHNHKITAGYLFKNSGMDKKPVLIEENVWAGSNVVILQGAIVKSGCVIGANSVVAKSTTKKGVYVGTPAILKNNID